jgi:lipopolysaccharide transport system permease protein
MSNSKTAEQWSTIIKAKTKWFNINLKEIFHYKDLIILFVKRDFVAYYQQALLGPFWYVLQPLLSTIVFTIIFGNIAKIPTDGIPQPIFYLAGLTIWNYFSSCLAATSNIFVSNASIFGKVYFPRMTVPISIIMSNFIKFIIQFMLFLLFFIYFFVKGSLIHPNIWILLTPVFVLQVAGLGMGFGILISSLTTKYRDLGFLVGFGLQLWMYATPIVYPISQVPEKWRFLFIFNPMASIVEGFRYSFLGSGKLDLFGIGISMALTIIVLFIGILSFSHVERSFMDRV